VNKIEISGFCSGSRRELPSHYGSRNVIIRRDKRQSYRSHKRRKNRRAK
jgi:hypothetical protein